MQEYDEPLTLELRTEREVTMFMAAVGTGAAFYSDVGMTKGAAALANLQIRLATEETDRVIGAINQYSDSGFLGGTLGGGEEMSPEAAVSAMVEHGEEDPDKLTEGGL